jgi:A/G-specific adenine glycosylase
LIFSSHYISNFQTRLLDWYKANKRKLPWRENNNPYHIWVSEVMLQQTQVKTTIPYFFRFIDRFPTIDALAKADLESVLKLWEGLGYYARARNLHKAAIIVHDKFKGHVPNDIDTFKQLPGVGDYIGAAVQSIAFDHPHAVVDGNVKRVLSRLLCNDDPVNHSRSHKIYLKYAQPLLDGEHAGDFNQAMMELGALVCTPKNPDCRICPVKKRCKAFEKGLTDQYPKRIQSKKTPTHHIAAGVVHKNGKMLITRRKLDGLLGGLWEFPGGKVKPKESSKQACIREIKEETSLDVTINNKITTVHHAYTHFKIRMDVYHCTCAQGDVRLNGPINHQWITLEQIDDFAFPKANLKFIPLLYEIL